MTKNIVTLLVSVSFSAAGQTFLKLGLNSVSEAERRGGLSVLRAAVGQPFVYLGIGLFGLSVLMWMTVLARTDLSWAYPLLGLSYVLVALSGRLVFGEELTPPRLVGIGLVLVGAVLIGRS